MIADHYSHFSRASLGAILSNAGFGFIEIDVGFVKKELFAIVKIESSLESENPIELNLKFLKGLIDQVSDLNKHHGKIRVFGTSIGTGWLYENCPNSFSFFVDEDPRWSGKHFYDKPIFLPQDVPSGSLVMIAQPVEVAIKIKQRLEGLFPSIKYIQPAT